MSMIGLSFVLPGPLAKSSVLVGSFFFGFWGALLSYVTVFGISIMFMCIFITYGYKILESENYRKIVTSVSCVNKGLMLYLVIMS
jgi:chromate transport protein ChrA